MTGLLGGTATSAPLPSGDRWPPLWRGRCGASYCLPHSFVTTPVTIVTQTHTESVRYRLPEHGGVSDTDCLSTAESVIPTGWDGRVSDTDWLVSCHNQ